MAKNRLEKQIAKTKIIATVGPAISSVQKIQQLIRAGVDIFRLNTAHGTCKDLEVLLKIVRDASSLEKRPVGVLLDLAGPKMRLGKIKNDKIECHLHQKLRFVKQKEATEDDLTITYEKLFDEIKKDDKIMLADGVVRLRVLTVSKSKIECEVIQSGIIRSKQGVNLPGVKLSAPSLSARDKENVKWACSHEIDFVGLSFVRSHKDVVGLKNLIKKYKADIQVISKVEKPEALEDLDKIIEVSDGIMVARGDLGVEIDIARIAVVQKEIISKCARMSRPVIIATQMLDSMQHSRLPTRAEVTDVSNAILDGADACMLSGETAIGEYPLECVQTMNSIALNTEEVARLQEKHNLDCCALTNKITESTVKAAGSLAEDLGAKLIAVMTKGGISTLLLSKHRYHVPTVGISDSEHILRRMCLYWGVIPLPIHVSRDNTGKEVIKWGKKTGILKAKDRIVVISGTGISTSDHNRISILEVE